MSYFGETTMIKLRDDIIFEDPESRIREYCDIEIYRGYDDKHNIDDYISKDDIDAANKLYAMIDRYDKDESKRLLSHSKSISKLLSSIPNKNISTISGEEWPSLRSKIKKLLSEFLSIKGIGLAKATKILHLKRPNLFPVLDSFVIKFLLDINMSDTVEKTRHLDFGLKALEKTRKIIKRQNVEFEKLVKQTRDLPIPLTPVRLFDILCWTTEKWDIRGKLNAPYGVPHKSLLASFESKKEMGARQKIFTRQKHKKRFSENGKFLFTRAYWMNVDKPTKTCVLHIEGCLYEKQKKETKWKGVGSLKRDGGWLRFNSPQEAGEFFAEAWKKRGFTYQKGCSKCTL